MEKILRICEIRERIVKNLWTDGGYAEFYLANVLTAESAENAEQGLWYL